MTEMLALGAPALPSGYFYRIGMAGFGYHKLGIRKERRFGSREIVNVIFHVDSMACGTLEEAIRCAAEMSMEKWEFRKESMARHCAMDQWIGDHK